MDAAVELPSLPRLPAEAACCGRSQRERPNAHTSGQNQQSNDCSERQEKTRLRHGDLLHQQFNSLRKLTFLQKGRRCSQRGAGATAGNLQQRAHVRFARADQANHFRVNRLFAAQANAIDHPGHGRMKPEDRENKFLHQVENPIPPRDVQQFVPGNGALKGFVHGRETFGEKNGRRTNSKRSRAFQLWREIPGGGDAEPRLKFAHAVGQRIKRVRGPANRPQPSQAQRQPRQPNQHSRQQHTGDERDRRRNVILPRPPVHPEN